MSDPIILNNYITSHYAVVVACTCSHSFYMFDVAYCCWSWSWSRILLFFGIFENRQWIVKVDEICSVELVGHKLFAPCNPYEYLSFQYGKGWSKPHENQNIVNVVDLGRVYSPEAWLHYLRDYSKDGKLDVNGTIDLLNKWNGDPNHKNITVLPNYELL